MDAEFWLQRWQEGRTGFHQEHPTPLLEAHWSSLDLPADSKVFVPLCGKTRDIDWLAAQGHRVLGVELSEIAVQQFFAEHDMVADISESQLGKHHIAGPIQLICGDVFALDAATLADCAAVYDRAAVIALPPPLRQRYAHELYARLPMGCRGLMITLDYPQHEKTGPPFSVDDHEVHALFDHDWHIEMLERKDILAEQPGFVAEGISALHTAAYRLLRR